MLNSSRIIDYAQFLKNYRLKTAYEWFLTPKNLEELGVNDDVVEVRRVGVGGHDYIDLYLDAIVLNYVSGQARGVRYRNGSS